MLLIEDAEREQGGEQPSTDHIEVVYPQENAHQLPPLLQPTPPPSEDQVPPVSGVGDPGWEHIEGSQGVLLLRAKVMDLMSQLISYGLAQEGRKKEVLHGIKSIRPVEAAFIVVLFPEDVFGSSWGWNWQRFWRWSLVDLQRDGDPSTVGLIDRREQGRTGHF